METIFPLEQATDHAKKCYPKEACGLWVGAELIFVPCEPSKAGYDHFSIPPQKWLEAEKAGKIKGIFHSHPDGPPTPSQADLTSMEAWGLPWVIMSWPSGERAVFEPCNKSLELRTENLENNDAPKAQQPELISPLLGRSFEMGTTDCYGLIRDYYGRLGIDIPDFERHQGWEKEGMNLYLDNYESAGFARVDEAQPHDVLLLQMGGSPVPNHGAIYLGDNRILQHLEGRLSARAVYGDYYRKATTHILRHRQSC